MELRRRNDDFLASCLAELERQGWDLDDYLERHPDLSEATRDQLRASAWLHRAPRPAPSAEFRARSRERLAALIQADAARPQTRLVRLRRSIAPFLRPVAAPLAAALLVAFGTAGVWTASAAALPDTPLYPAKLALEQVQVLVAMTPEQKTAAHLSRAAERLREASVEAREGNEAVVPQLLASSDREIASAQAMARAQAVPPDDRLAREVTKTVASLQTQRQQVTSETVALAPTAPPRPTDGRGGPTPAATNPSAPDDNGGTARDVARAVVTAATSDRPDEPTKPSARPSSVAAAPTRSGAESPSPAPAQPTASQPASPVPPQPPAPPTVAPPTAAPSQPVQTASPTAAPPTPAPTLDATERLLRDLIGDAVAGNVADANAAAQQFVAAVQATPANRAVIGRLRAERAMIELALIRAPATTRPALDQALGAVNAALVAASGGTGAGTQPPPGINGAPSGATEPGTEDKNAGNAPSSSQDDRFQSEASSRGGGSHRQ